MIPIGAILAGSLGVLIAYLIDKFYIQRKYPS